MVSIMSQEFVMFEGKKISVIDDDLSLRGDGINNIKDVKGLETLKRIKFLDLSHNNITEICGLENLVRLETLFLSHNKITNIDGLDSLTQMKDLILSYNQIEEIKNLDSLKRLKILNLASNSITEIENLSELNNLIILDLSKNKITEIKNLEILRDMTNLEILELSQNPFLGYDEYIVRSGGGPRRILEYSLRKKRGDVGYLEFYKKDLGYNENIEIFKSELNKLNDSDFIDIGTYKEYGKYRMLQNLVFFEDEPEIIELSSENNDIKEIMIHLIQLHSLKGVNPPLKDGKFDKLEYFNFFLRHFWDVDVAITPKILKYNSYESRAGHKLDEILYLSKDDYNGKPNLIIFPENTIPYNKVEDLKEFSKLNDLIIIGGLEHKTVDNSSKNINQAIIIDKGKEGYQIKQTPVRIYHSNKIEYTEENINCEYFPKIKIFTTTIGRIAIFICKDFLRLCEIIPYWAYKHEIDFVIIPSLTGKVLSFHSRVLNLLNYSDYT